jgi:hypothetical protein
MTGHCTRKWRIDLGDQEQDILPQTQPRASPAGSNTHVMSSIPGPVNIYRGTMSDHDSL